MIAETGLTIYWDRDAMIWHASAVEGRTICGEPTDGMNVVFGGNAFESTTCDRCVTRMKKAMHRMVAEMQAIGGDDDDDDLRD